MDDWMRFMGIWISDGSVCKNANTVCICQKNQPKTEKIKRLLEKLPFKFTEEKDVFCIYDKQLSEYLRPFGKSFEKYVPTFIKNSSKEQIKLFYNGIALETAL